MGLCTSLIPIPLDYNVFTEHFKEANYYPCYQLFSIYFEIHFVCQTDLLSIRAVFIVPCPTVVLASAASRALVLNPLSVRSLSDLSKDLPQPWWILIEARVTQILWGPLVEVVVQHRSCEQKTWGGYNAQNTENTLLNLKEKWWPFFVSLICFLANVLYNYCNRGHGTLWISNKWHYKPIQQMKNQLSVFT